MLTAVEGAHGGGKCTTRLQVTRRRPTQTPEAGAHAAHRRRPWRHVLTSEVGREGESDVYRAEGVGFCK
jgi:hypothetical protein